MAVFTTEKAVLRLTFVTGMDENGKSKLSSRTYRNLRPNAIADDISQVAIAMGSLSEHSLLDVHKVQTESVDY